MTPAAGFTQPEEDRTAGSASALVRKPAAKPSSLKPNHIRSLALAGAVVGVALLPIAAAQATPPQTSSQTQNTASGQSGSPLGASGLSAAQPAQALSGEFCGANQSESISGGTVQLQVCVEQQNGTVFAQAYVTNDGTVPQIVAVNLTRSDGTLVQSQCVVAAGAASTPCATSPIPASQGSGAYDSIAEAAEQGKPLSDGAVHVESGPVAPVQAASSSATASNPSSDS
ncbi:MAG TPA: hypothetical protein VGM10_16650 [Actinocrinis sp.]